MAGRRAPSKVWLALASVLCIHLLCWKAAAPLRHSHSPTLALAHAHARSHLVPRAFELRPRPRPGPGDEQPHPAAVAEPDPEHEQSASLIDYMAHWERATPQTKGPVFAAMVLWLVFLFAFVGITASDFFCPNLSTIASRLGMSESVAGVTFLAFSNGSPDVFSTFAALRQHSGSLAIGELIGAASFIVSVVAGTMCVVQPFKVARHTFLRDVGFFTVAVAFTLAILWDSHIHAWEALAMVGLYAIYVMIVAIGSWWMARRERQREVVRQARSEYASDAGSYHDDPIHSPYDEASIPYSRHSSPSPTPRRPSTPSNGSYPFPSISAPTTPATLHPHMHQTLDQDTLVSLAERGTTVTITRTRSGSVSNHSPTNRRPKTRSTVRPSLLGAIEFRDVVNSLRADSSARTLAVFGGRDDHGHGHASVVGAEGFYDPGALGAKAQTRPGRSASHSGAQRPVLASVESQPPQLTGSRSASWTAEMGGAPPTSAGGTCVEDHGHWGESEDEDADREGPLIDLSAGVDNPWKASWGGREQSLKVEIPVYSSSAATSPRTLRRKPSSASVTSVIGKPVPSIRLTTATGDESELSSQPKPGFFSIRHRRGYLIARAVFLALFPSLQDFRAKSFVGKATAILCVPAILVLNLTLPVVDIDEDDCVSIEDKERDEGFGNYQDDNEDEDRPLGPTEGLLIDTHETGHYGHRRGRSESDVDYQSREARDAIAQEFHSHVVPHSEVDLPSPWATPLDLDRERGNSFSIARTDSNPDFVPSTPASTVGGLPPVDQNVHSSVLTRWLTAVQCTLGPVFCVTALFVDDFTWWYPLAALGVGLCLGGFAFYCFEDHRHPGRVVLCFVGFLVAMVWILMIVNEVVGVLQTIGHIFGLSDAILGLTIFAMGNSLGDLVANATVARMGFPSMAIAACFGGPMLNILLGVGLSGSYLIITGGGDPLHVEMGRTLIVSGAGLLTVLLGTLVAVPWNGYMMSKRMGWTLIGAYVIVLSINVLVEVFL